MREKVVSLFFIILSGIATLSILIIIFIILGNIVLHGVEKISINFLTSSPSHGMTAGGIFPAIFGTFALVILMTIFCIPLGVATAVYLNEYSQQDSKVVYILRLAIQNLAGVPSIVYGLFGLGFFIQFLGRGVDKIFYGGELMFGQPAILWASATLALLTLPTVIVATEEAIRTVPYSLREAAYSLGATRWQVVRFVVLPNAIPGILTGGILAVSRGAGEVAPVMFTGAAYFLPYLPTKLNDQFMELGYHVYVMSTQSPDVEKTLPILYSTVLVLLILTFLLNFTAIILRAKIRRRLRR